MTKTPDHNDALHKELADLKAQMAVVMKLMQDPAEATDDSFADATFARDRQMEAAQRAYGSLSVRFATLEQKLAQSDQKLEDLTRQLKQAQSAHQAVLGSKRWRLSGHLAEALRRPGRNTLALPLRLWRVLRGR